MLISYFGIALAVGAAAGGRLTETGLSLGTPHYMSSEQATGDANVGPATDVYALGCVLHEMLVGDPPHVGSTPQAILGKIITEPPASVTRYRKTVPANVEAAIGRSLEKVPADRFATAGQMRDALHDPAFRGASSELVAPALAGSGWSHALGAALVAMTGLAAWGWIRDTAPDETRRIVSLDLSGLVDPTWASISPTGDLVAVVAEDRLWIRPLDQFAFREVPGTEGARSPDWSPDGEWVAFAVEDEILKVHRSGESMTTVMRMPDACGGMGVCGPSWTDDGRIIVASGYTDLFVAPTEGGAGDVLIPRGEGEHFHRSLALPGGAVLLLVDPDERVVGIELWDGATHTPMPDMRPPLSYARGYVFYHRDDAIWAIGYSESTRSFVGDPFFVASDLRLLGAVGRGAARRRDTRLRAPHTGHQARRRDREPAGRVGRWTLPRLPDRGSGRRPDPLRGPHGYGGGAHGVHPWLRG